MDIDKAVRDKKRTENEKDKNDIPYESSEDDADLTVEQQKEKREQKKIEKLRKTLAI